MFEKWDNAEYEELIPESVEKFERTDGVNIGSAHYAFIGVREYNTNKYLICYAGPEPIQQYAIRFGDKHKQEIINNGEGIILYLCNKPKVIKQINNILIGIPFLYMKLEIYNKENKNIRFSKQHYKSAYNKP